MPSGPCTLVADPEVRRQRAPMPVCPCTGAAAAAAGTADVAEPTPTPRPNPNWPRLQDAAALVHEVQLGRAIGRWGRSTLYSARWRGRRVAVTVSEHLGTQERLVELTSQLQQLVNRWAGCPHRPGSRSRRGRAAWGAAAPLAPAC